MLSVMFPSCFLAALLATADSVCAKLGSEQLYQFREQVGFEGLADSKHKRWQNLPSPPSALYHYRFVKEINIYPFLLQSQIGVRGSC